MEFYADSFKDMAEQSKTHGMKMFQAGDKDHLIAMQKMQELFKSSETMAKWMESKRKEFDSLPDND